MATTHNIHNNAHNDNDHNNHDDNDNSDDDFMRDEIQDINDATPSASVSSSMRERSFEQMRAKIYNEGFIHGKVKGLEIRVQSEFDRGFAEVCLVLGIAERMAGRDGL